MKEVSIKKNIAISIAAQIVTLLSGFVLQMLVPKFIDIYQYSYWQMYVLYAGYVGVLHFGLLDGFILRYSQHDIDDLDKELVRSQLVFLLFITSVASIILAIIASMQTSAINKSVMQLVAIGIIVKNIFTYASYTFQITNRIKEYAMLIVVHRASYALIVVILIIGGVHDYRWYCAADLIGNVLGILWGYSKNKSLFWGRTSKINQAIRELKLNISSGFLLMTATLSASAIVGVAKMVIQWRWDNLVFGMVSFGFSVTALFMVFVAGVSTVLFPQIKRMDEKALPDLYAKLRNGLSAFFLLVLLAYFPLAKVLEIWLPSYTSGIKYVGILLPVIIFTSKLDLLTNTFLKAYRREKLIFRINVVSIVLASILYLFGAYIFSSIDFILFSVFFITILRESLSEKVVERIIERNYTRQRGEELVVAIIFIILARYLSLMWGGLIYALVLMMYFYVNRETVSIFIREKLRRHDEK